MTMITPSYLGETIEYSSLHACRSTLEDPTPTHFLTKTRVQPQQLEALVLTLLRNSRQMEEASPIVSADRHL